MNWLKAKIRAWLGIDEIAFTARFAAGEARVAQLMARGGYLDPTDFDHRYKVGGSG